jgi:hypothetical protein
MYGAHNVFYGSDVTFILLNCNIVGYFQYVNDLLIIYETKTDIEDLLYRFNNITPKLTSP